MQQLEVRSSPNDVKNARMEHKYKTPMSMSHCTFRYNSVPTMPCSGSTKSTGRDWTSCTCAHTRALSSLVQTERQVRFPSRPSGPIAKGQAKVLQNVASVSVLHARTHAPSSSFWYNGSGKSRTYRVHTVQNIMSIAYHWVDPSTCILTNRSVSIKQ